MRDGVDYLPLVRELQKVDYSLFAEPNNDTLSSKPEEQFVMKLYSAVPEGKYVILIGACFFSHSLKNGNNIYDNEKRERADFATFTAV